MKNRLVVTIAALCLATVGAACGGDDSGGGGGGSVQQQLASELIRDAGDEGMGVDESCVRRVTGELSDADARALLEDSEDDLSPQGAVALFELFSCIDFDFDDFDLDDFDLDDFDLDDFDFDD